MGGGKGMKLKPHDKVGFGRASKSAGRNVSEA